ncbi:MAG: hypothetical protein K9H61_10105 [Bacteroidia bacterium]|nr:hypothetical protein [Bacteroidia bacterium]MCF8425166.1 hypothetical protein [Bacteroidia bacterium]MCF8447335.1 hypothetical protein [Bacteroidia bacterium]
MNGYAARYYSLLLMLSIGWTLCAQNPNYEILSPRPNSIIGSENLLVSIRFNQPITEQKFQIYLDNIPIQGINKLKAKQVEFLYLGNLSNGKHHLVLNYRYKGSKKKNIISWTFYVNYNQEQLKGKSSDSSKTKPFQVTGGIVLDNRNTVLTGTGASLRQEPPSTATFSADVNIQKGDLSIPIRYFTTSDNLPGVQSRDFFQVGLHYKGIEVDYGDINPSLDKLILTGIRMRGFSVLLKSKNTSISFFQGSLNQKIEGSIGSYSIGDGFIPSNVINDSQYLVPGTYQRNMMASRLALGGKRGNFIFGVNALKIKDDTSSIKYGVLPKDNIAAGADIVMKLFKQKIVLSGGIAASAITNDISYGVIDPQQVDTTFGIKLGFDPMSLKNILIINASTVPTDFTNTDMVAYYGNFQHNTKHHNFAAEYRKNGGSFNSLGNPYLRKNYNGYNVTERIGIFKRKLNLSINYQNFSNNLNQSLPSLLKTEIRGAGFTFSPHTKLPSLTANYQTQTRNSESLLLAIPSIKDQLTTRSLFLFYRVKFWGINHNFRIYYGENIREDIYRPETNNTYTNYLFSLSEGFGKRVNLTLDYSLSSMNDFTGIPINSIESFGALLTLEIVKKKFFLNLSTNQNKNQIESLGYSLIRQGNTIRLQYNLTNAISIEAEGGYMPFNDQGDYKNNYEEKYIYLRLTYQLIPKTKVI